MKLNKAKLARKIAMVLMGTAFCYVGAVTMLTGAVTVARQVRK